MYKKCIMLFTALLLAGIAVTAVADGLEMDLLMNMKLDQWGKMRAEGMFGPNRVGSVTQKVPCSGGKAGEYECDHVDLLSFLSHEDLGSTTRHGNDVWGWTSPDGREFGAAGQTDGTAFVEIDGSGLAKYLGRLPTQTGTSPWRDMKVIDGYVYIGSEAYGHGLQVFDMRKLLDLESPKLFDIETDLTAWYGGFGSSHNIVAHEEKKMIYAVGTDRSLDCGGGLFMVDVSNPAKPVSPGCASQDGYVHDAQCVVYQGPDLQYLGREICFNYNEDTLTIVDVTIKTNPVQISRTPYVGASYTHQGWLINPAHMTYLLLDDELDEVLHSGVAANERTTTYIFNITSLANPINTGFYQSPAKSIDHNQYVVNGLSYQSNYNSGLRIVNVSSVEEDPRGESFTQVGFFDCFPEDDELGGVPRYTGSWSAYPYFKSGHILLNSIDRGLYVLEYNP